MNRVSEWNYRAGKSPSAIGSPEWVTSMKNQLSRLQEELNETRRALYLKDYQEVLDGLVDLKVVLEGAEYLSNLPVEAAFDMVMDNNDLKITKSIQLAIDTLEVLGKDEHSVVTAEFPTDSGDVHFSVHRDLDSKICKLNDHPKVDLSPLME